MLFIINLQYSSRIKKIVFHKQYLLRLYSLIPCNSKFKIERKTKKRKKKRGGGILSHVFENKIKGLIHLKAGNTVTVFNVD